MAAVTPTAMRAQATDQLIAHLFNQLIEGAPQAVLQGPFDPAVKAAVAAAYTAEGWAVDSGDDYISVEYP